LNLSGQNKIKKNFQTILNSAQKAEKAWRKKTENTNIKLGPEGREGPA